MEISQRHLRDGGEKFSLIYNRMPPPSILSYLYGVDQRE